jgi:hypothetical protein
VYKELGSVIGASVEIETSYGKLCRDLDFADQTGAWVGIQDNVYAL